MSNLLVCCVIISFVGNLLPVNGRYDPDQDGNNMFANDTNIVSLTDENFDNNLLKQQNSYLLLLYSHLCPNCVSLMIEIKEFAKQIHSWSSVFRISSLNCITFPMFCAHLNVTKFPSYILVPANSKEIPKNLTQELLTISQLKAEILTFLQAQNKQMSSHNFELTLINRKQEICNFFQFQNRISSPFAIFEPLFGTHNEGFQLLLDLLNYRETIQIKRFYTTNHKLIEELNLSSDNLPSLFSVEIHNGSCQFNLISKYEENDINKFRKKSIEHIIQKFPLDSMTETLFREVVNDTDTIDNRNVQLLTSGLTYTDLYNTIRLALVKDLHRFKVFNEDEVNILKEFYIVMHANFPFRNENVRRYFKRMNIWWSKRPDPKNVSLINYYEATRISDGFLMPITDWKHCRGSKRYYRGYSCGIWSLFHVLTVHEYYNYKHPRPPKVIYTNNNLLKNNKNYNHTREPSMKHESLHVMIKFIPTFFSCTTCASNFNKSTIDYDSHLINPESSILYLWRLHNQINARLTYDKSFDPLFPKHQFPSKDLCPTCSDRNGIFNETEVFQFLLHFYGKQTLRTNSDD